MLKNSSKFDFLLVLASLMKTIGIILLVSMLYGMFRPGLKTISESKIYQAPQAYYQNILEYQSAQKEFEQLKSNSNLSNHEKSQKLLEIISNSFLHIPDRAIKIDFFDNWFLWLSALKNPQHLISQDADFMWRRGGGFCDQAAMIYSAKAQELDIPARLVWLNGHVISEILLDKKWSAVDPDLAIFWDKPASAFGQELSHDQIKSKIENSGYETKLAEKIATIYSSVEDNRYSLMPYLPSLYAYEKKAVYPASAIPIFLILVGVFIKLKFNKD